MLILTRRQSEKLMIGDEIVVDLLSVDPGIGAVRVGISAPDSTIVESSDFVILSDKDKPEAVVTHKRRRRI
ncbi:carbon storage regulator [Pseudomonas syringae group sp. J309-1]|uniref:carbon storage regulator n=1 Tax=Pseudomonas syringae group sp. J309-1 TaxID=3079588 RepID=UPI00290B959C|nr:carbon storage regulator [Pseudomonas syringae group sp. J309-1]MDU8358430.1 carbon storage regulator [Pseudomonas syringae group sp. J309-1]